jgi:hypothetical protein
MGLLIKDTIGAVPTKMFWDTGYWVFFEPEEGQFGYWVKDEDGEWVWEDILVEGYVGLSQYPEEEYVWHLPKGEESLPMLQLKYKIGL